MRRELKKENPIHSFNMTKFDRQFFRNVGALAAPYWRSEEKWGAWGLLAVIVSMNLGMVYVNVLLNQWNNEFYNALQNLDKAAFVKALWRFSYLAAAYIVIAVYQVYLSQMLQIRWRRWLTRRYLERWLGNHAYYRMQLRGNGTDNPDQRISDDIGLFVDRSLNLSLGLLTSVVTLVSFTTILWHLSGALSFSLGTGREFSIPGYMFWAAVGYALIGTWVTARIGRPLIRLNFDQQRYEADFRFSLVRLRENSESIALYRGENQEQAGFANRFRSVVDNYWQIMRRQKRLTWFTAGYSQVAIIFPILVAAPRFFSKEIQLGGLMQIAQAFGQVQGALSYLINSYTDIANWRAVVERLSSFTAGIRQVDEDTATGRAIAYATSPDGLLRVNALRLHLPDGSPLLEDVELQLAPGQSMLITGPSGSGKSSLIRALAGIWPFGEGRVLLPIHARVLFLPQKPYLPLGTLKEVLFYPNPPGDQEELSAVLECCKLPQLKDRLDDYDNWSQTLSLGEQQRVAFARALLAKPNFLFLDEATSALDEPTEAVLYRLLKDRLPETAIISVGHRTTLQAWHDIRVNFLGDGKWCADPAVPEPPLEAACTGAV